MSLNIHKNFAISTWAINNKMTVYVITAILLVGGLISYYSMPRESFPEIIETKIYVSSINPGNSAEDVEKLITKPLEEEFNNISGVTKITSNTLEDYSMILVEFDEDISVEDAAVTRKRDDPFLNARSRSVVEANHWRSNLEGHVHEFVNLLGVHLAKRPTKHGEVLREHKDLAPIDGAPTRDDPVGVGPFLATHCP